MLKPQKRTIYALLRLPYSKYAKPQKANSKAKCDKCGKIKRVRHMVFIKGVHYCTNCKPNKIWIVGDVKKRVVEKRK